MPRDYYPRREADIVSFTANFGSRVTSEPELYGLTPEMVAGYMDLQRAFAGCYQAVQTPGGDSSITYAQKEAARVALEAATRPLVRCLSSRPGMTDAMRIGLGLKPRAARRRHVGPPTEAPDLRVLGAAAGGAGRTVRVELRQHLTLRRGRPRDVLGAMLYAYAGDVPSPDPRAWRHMRISSKANVELHFDASLPAGAKVWLRARWLNRRGECGPNSGAVETHVPFGGAFPVAPRRAA